MTEEEKKVINKAKSIINIYQTSNHLSELLVKLDIEELEILINLIETQQKEIKYLKGQIPQDKIFYYSEKDYISKDKIINKIEKLEKRKKDLLELEDSCARTIGIEDCDEKIILYNELLEE